VVLLHGVMLEGGGPEKQVFADDGLAVEFTVVEA
jgi:hypothetical protein